MIHEPTTNAQTGQTGYRYFVERQDLVASGDAGSCNKPMVRSIWLAVGLNLILRNITLRKWESRCFVGCWLFQDLVEQIALAEIKRHTNSIEQTYALEGKRQLNLDPGYLLYERFVLASGKNFTHRVYIGNMIYADLTLIYQKGAFQTLPWTYPDYAEARSQIFFNASPKKICL